MLANEEVNENEWIFSSKVASFNSDSGKNDPLSTFVMSDSNTNSLSSKIDESNAKDFILTNYLNSNQKNSFDNDSNDFEKSLINNMLAYSRKNFDLANSKSKSALTAETLRVLSSINIENLSFNSQVDLLFNDLSILKASAVQGLLAETNFRFLAWSIFLECIDLEKSNWVEEFTQNRLKYEKIKKDLCCDPRLNDTGSDKKFLGDLTNESSDFQSEFFDHPLSQNQKSKWNRHFTHKGLKSVIIQDVIRINQHSDYFSEESTKNLIVDLLFIYVQSTNSEYKQGMHEILACIMYVLHIEYQNILNSKETNETIRQIIKIEYLEHDSFTIFEALMTRMRDWFDTKLSNKLNLGNDKYANTHCSGLLCENRKISVLNLNPKLFQENQEFYESAIINKINHITNDVLKNNDIELYNHLNKIEVSLHPFGIRWLRLLFLRELDFPHCLVLWDAMFATDNQELSLVNYLFVALLSALRDDILRMDNSSCMKLLMQPHFQLDPIDVLKTALYLQNPAIYARPASMDHSYEIVNFNYLKPSSSIPTSLNTTTSNSIKHNIHSSSAIFKSPNKNEVLTSSNSKSANKYERDRNNNSNSSGSHANKKLTDSNEFNLTRIAKKLEYDQMNYLIPFANDKKQIKKNFEMKLISMQHITHNLDLVNFAYINKISELQNENIGLNLKIYDLTAKLEELEELCTLCSTKMNANIGLLQDEFVKVNNLKEDDLIQLAIAGLKQVRDQLNPLFRNLEDEQVSQIDMKKNLNYRQYHQDQLTQTSFDSNSSSSSLDLANNDSIFTSIVNSNKKTIKKKLTSLFKTSSIDQTTNTTEEKNFQSRFRSLSLKNYQIPNNFLPQSFSFGSNSLTKSESKSLAHVDNEQMSHLDDEDLVKMNLNNMKLVLNQDENNKITKTINDQSNQNEKF